MMFKPLNFNQPLTDRVHGPLNVIARLESGSTVVQPQSIPSYAFSIDKYGRKILPNSPASQVRVTNAEPIIVEYLSLYPTGQVYKKDCCPVSNSSYDLENLIQIKVTRQGDKIIDKEFV